MGVAARVMKHYEERLLFASPEKRLGLVFPSPYLRHAATRLVIERMEVERGGHWRYVEHGPDGVHGFEGRYRVLDNGKALGAAGQSYMAILLAIQTAFGGSMNSRFGQRQVGSVVACFSDCSSASRSCDDSARFGARPPEAGPGGDGAVPEPVAGAAVLGHVGGGGHAQKRAVADRGHQGVADRDVVVLAAVPSQAQQVGTGRHGQHRGPGNAEHVSGRPHLQRVRDDHPGEPELAAQ